MNNVFELMFFWFWYIGAPYVAIAATILVLILGACYLDARSKLKSTQKPKRSKRS